MSPADARQVVSRYMELRAHREAHGRTSVRNGETVLSLDDLKSAIRAIPLERRESLFWSVIAGRSTAEVANLLGRSPGTVREEVRAALNEVSWRLG